MQTPSRAWAETSSWFWLPTIADEVQVEEIAERLIKAISEPHELSGRKVVARCSIGIAIFPDNGESAEALMANADNAMYQAKATGRGSAIFFTEEMNTRLRERMQMEQDLNLALELGQLALHFQPIFDTASQRHRGAEVLLRWHHPALVMIPVNFNYWIFAVLVFFNGLGGGIFTAPNTAAIMSSVPAAERGAASGVRATFFNAGSSLSIGIFFSLMIIGLANTLPTALSSGLQEQGVSASVAHEVANLPPVGSLFAAFLGYNPIAELLEPYHALQQPGVNTEVLTGQTFFPHLITEPFHSGLVVVFVAAAAMMVIGMIASMFNPGRYADAPGADNEV